MAPGLFPSVIAAGLTDGRDPSKEHHSELRYIPARRFGGEQEMAGSILYLASRAGSAFVLRQQVVKRDRPSLRNSPARIARLDLIWGGVVSTAPNDLSAALGAAADEP
ncbi:hypothetical protein O1611_g10647 [Lasiodiplodia mahajangana]|uniref:Uncharacterized protein n=1 Tax=Lasiodiplodia mahajangana TaxID=1108764 RepID=A0ACC2IVN1_9PEZI|nr:hypothetical protein O1611_g10647 [Lasiodiplodia mahajangana]